MAKYITFLCFALVLIASCNSKPEYKYVETLNNESGIEGNNIINNSASASAATTSSPVTDPAKASGLKKFFRLRKEEFSSTNTIWYEPKTAPTYVNANGIYCYFATENGKPNALRFRVQYYSEEWLFIEAIHFLIDGNVYDYIPSKMDRDSGNGGYIWEWFDESISSVDKALIIALSNAKTAKMKFEGQQYVNTKTISAQQIKGIKQTLELYAAMGGQY